jgi:hypothetical protein
MGHEDAVYLAKLAEQAERYEGSPWIPLSLLVGFQLLTHKSQRWSRT